MTYTTPRTPPPTSDSVAEQNGISLGRPDHTEKHSDRRGFARAVASEKGVDLAAFDAQVDPLDRPGLVVVLRKTPCLNDWGHRAPKTRSIRVKASESGPMATTVSAVNEFSQMPGFSGSPLRYVACALDVGDELGNGRIRRRLLPFRFGSQPFE